MFDGVTGQVLQKTNRALLNITLRQFSYHYAPINVNPEGGGRERVGHGCGNFEVFSKKISNSPPPRESNIGQHPHLAASEGGQMS